MLESDPASLDGDGVDQLGVDQLLQLDTRPAEPGTVITASGELDMLTSPRLRNLLLEHLDQRPARVVLDLRGLVFLGSSGLAVLMEGREAARDCGAALALVGHSREVLRPLEATGISQLFEIHPDLETALAAD